MVNIRLCDVDKKSFWFYNQGQKYMGMLLTPKIFQQFVLPRLIEAVIYSGAPCLRGRPLRPPTSGLCGLWRSAGRDTVVLEMMRPSTLHKVVNRITTKREILLNSHHFIEPSPLWASPPPPVSHCTIRRHEI
jgi:hypothetical protein